MTPVAGDFARALPANAEHCEHAGLLLTRCTNPSVLSEAAPKTQLIRRIIAACARSSELYRAAFAQRERMLRSRQHFAACRALDLAGALAIGLGYPVALGQAVSLHHLYGTPLIPGSSLKGVLRAYVESLPDAAFRSLFAAVDGADGIDNAQCRHLVVDILFGDVDGAGFVDVLDAWVDPRNVERCASNGAPSPPARGVNVAALHADVITPHHTAYMTGNADAAPADWDLPTPVPFVSAAGRFHFALIWQGGDAAFDRAVFAQAQDWFVDALCGAAGRAGTGVGAKTAS
ncbi:MAG TPA: type III-B CRISPR module RAMP protein Cmr6, partial [Tahibacter sp.]|nr:type III-B CRISPR module RAMP protein Cmr6 [Tahibacter sp.]